MSSEPISAQARLEPLSQGKAQLLELLLDKKAGRSKRIRPLRRAHRQGEICLPTSWAQQRLWFIDQLEGRSEAYHISVAVRLHGELDRTALEAALQELIMRHEVLRTVFIEVDGEPVQKILPEMRCTYAAVDLRPCSPQERELELSRHTQKEMSTPFDLSVGPLIRGRLLQLADDEHMLLIVMHHIVSDGWSMAVFVRELGALYGAHREGCSGPLPPLPIQYADYAMWERQQLGGTELQEHLRYWLEHLRGAPELLQLPVDRPRPATQSYRGENVSVMLDAGLAAQLRAFSRQLNLTLAMTLQAAWTVVLSRLSGQNDIVLGMPVANRQRTETEGLIGFLVNTLAVRVRLDDDPSVTDLLRRVKETMLDAYAHHDVPFDKVVEALRPARSLDHSPIFQVMFVLQNAPSETLRLAGLTLREEEVPLQTAKFDLILALQEKAEGLCGSVNFATNLFDRTTIERWVGCFEVVLRAMLQRPDLQVSKLPLLSESERRDVLERFNATQAPYPLAECAHQLFEEQVERAPAAVAVVCQGRSLTYGELDARSNQLARYLREHGVGPDTRVAVCVERSLDLVIGILGVLKAGGAYVPLDSSCPAERLAYMLGDSEPIAILTQQHLKDSLPATQARVITLDVEDSPIRSRSISKIDRQETGLQPHHLAYVIYTSGSTGTPKGVLVEHRNLVNLIRWHCDAFDIRAGSRSSAVAAVGFDAATWEIFPPLSVGGTLVLAPCETADVEALLAWWASEPLDVGFLPTPIAELVFSRNIQNPRLRTLLIGGDKLRQRAPAQTVTLINNYGPTETTVVATSGRLESDDAVLHIGRPIANTHIYVLDQHGAPVPIGVRGEIYIGGAGVARGYLNRPDQQAQRFVPDPFSAQPGARMYRSGDLGRWRTDGTIEFLGRNDEQVKIRGFRIELGEIEALLAQHPNVSEAAVLAREHAGGKRLVAYVTMQPGGAVSAEALRAHLKTVLPDYMVPSAVVMMESFPLTSNGKLDRRALPPPPLSAYATRQYEAPQGEVEEILAGIWQELMGAERIGRQDNFFELGGHSLLIVQMMERLRRVGLSPKVRHVFESPTLAELATTIVRGAVGQAEVPPNLIPDQCAAITPQMLPLVELQPQHIDRISQAVPGGASNIQDIYPLAPLQEGILFHHLMSDRDGDTYVLPILLSIASQERLSELIAALQAVIDRHDILRTAVLWEELPVPIQVVYRKATLPVAEAVLDPQRDSTEQAKQWMEPEHQRLDLRYAPLLRLQIAADPHSMRWYAMLQLHHITADHVALDIVVSEIVAYLEHRADGLPDPAPFRNHVAQALAYARSHDAQSFFRSKLGDLNEPTAPFGLLNVHDESRRIEDAYVEFEPAFAQRVRAQARRLGVTAATLFHTGWALVMAHTAGRSDVVFGTVLLGRLQSAAGAQRTLGMFINTLPLRLQLQNLSATELVHQTQRELVELLIHEQASLAMAQRCSGVGAAALFTGLLNYRHYVRNPDAKWSRASGVEMLGVKERTNYPITLSVDDMGDSFRLKAQTDSRIDPRRMAAYLHTALLSLVEALEETATKPALLLRILPEDERQEVIERLNDTCAPFPQEKLVHELFEDQTLLTPDAVAVVQGEQSITYGELNAKANQLAQYLLLQGVEPGDVVGIYLDRSVEMVVGLLAVLKVGAAYMPLDPNYPSTRLRHMVEDAAPRVLLTQQDLQSSLPATSAELVLLDETLRQIQSQPAENLPAFGLGLTPNNVVYVIYTSGSTGRPKGTAMPHRSMVNLIEWHRMNLPLSKGQRVLQFAALSFDVAFQEIFTTLCVGGVLVLLDEWTRKDPCALVQLLNDQSVDRLFVPPLMLQSIAEYCKTLDGELPPLREVITAGEQLRISPEIVGLFKGMTGCRLHNHYGPTETHVVTALTLPPNPDTWPVLPTIGRPIANSKIYVLGEHTQPVPLGAVGEIYIAGAGLAEGYLHRRELTSQRFVRDPFSADGDARMYRTGDLGRWRADGTLEYLGRNDDQVKIRGFRIELREIEAKLAQHLAVREAVVIAREDAIGSKRLVAYVTSFGALAVEELRDYLKAGLPEHMIPDAFVSLDRLPTTPSGKVDRRALPPPGIDAYVTSRYEAPQGDVEASLARICEEVLRIERVGRDDNFFEIGGHSLLALEALLRINQVFDAGLKVKEIYKNPTVRDLATRICGTVAEDLPIDLAKEAALDDGIQPLPGIPCSEEKAVLLTGATGFVGRFLLAELLQDCDATIYCLVRAQSQQQATSRLRATLDRWDLWRDESGTRIVAVPGDLRLPRLGIPDAIYHTLCDEVDSVYHCGTSMNHLETYAMARAANVDSAREILKLATCQKRKVVNYISTLGIFTASAVDPLRVVDEGASIDYERHLNSQGYIGSKWVSEKIFLTAAERGIPCNVFRLGLVWADTQQGRFDELQNVYRVMKSSLLSGFGIRDYKYPMPPTPVDFVARAIVWLARQHRDGCGVFHISSPGQLLDGVFERCNEVADTSLELLSFYEWIGAMKRLHNQGYSVPAVPIIEFAFSMNEVSFSEHLRNGRSAANIRFDCRRTLQELDRAGLTAPLLDDDLLRICLTDMLSRDSQPLKKIEGRRGAVFGTNRAHQIM